MEEPPGSLGTKTSLSLRLGQAMFSSASLLFMSVGVDFYSYTAFCYLVTIMGLVTPWSFTMAMVDGYSLFMQCPLRQPNIMVIIVVGDWVLSMLSLAAACATASSIELLLKIDGQFCAPKFCSRYELSIAMALMSWILTGASSLSNLWILASW